MTNLNNETLELTIDELAGVSGGSLIGDIVKGIIVDIIVDHANGLTKAINYVRDHNK
jgi:hypothetical protein